MQSLSETDIIDIIARFGSDSYALLFFIVSTILGE